MPFSDHELQADFDTEVLELSKETPVVVDFWAEWCGPCRMLGPVLEKLAAEAAGRWRLVKVDTEAHPELAQQYDIRGIPAVKMFHLGRPIAEFVGALPEEQIQQWLRTHLPRQNVRQYAAALAAQEGGDLQAARELLETIVANDPTDHEARLQLARVLMELEPAEAGTVAEAIPEDAREHEAAQHLGVLIRLIRWARGASQEVEIEDSTAEESRQRYREAAQALADQRYGDAVEIWIDLLQRDRKLDEDGARRACIAVFAFLGEESPITQEHRRRFSMALY